MKNLNNKLLLGYSKEISCTHSYLPRIEMEEENKIQQQEEAESLSSIYGSEWKTEPDSESSYSIQINKDVQLFVSFTDKYPSTAPPLFQLLAPTLSSLQKETVHDLFRSIYE